MYNFTSLIRRLIFVWSIFYVESGSLQIALLVVINMMMMVYLIHVKPLKLRSKNRVELFNEILTQLISFHTVAMTQWVDD